MQRSWGLALVGMGLFLLLGGVVVGMSWLLGDAQVWPRLMPTAVRQRSTELTPKSHPPMGELVEPTVTPAPPVLLVDVHVEADVRGAGSVQARASSRNGQALANIESQGDANGHALVNAPTCSGTCEPLNSDGPLGQAMTTPTQGSTLTQVNGPEGARLVVATDFVNLRAGPGTEYALIGSAVRGQMLAIVGRDEAGNWWQIVDSTSSSTDKAGMAWINDALVQVVEAAGVPVLHPAPPALGDTAAPALRQRSTELTPKSQGASGEPVELTPTPTYAFEVVRARQHSEIHSVNLYVWVHDGTDQPLDGYRLDVRRNGMPAPGLHNQSSLLRLGSTRPACPGCAENQPYNLKDAWDNLAAFPDRSYAGVWAVQLLDRTSQPVSDVVLFTLAADDPWLELFIEFRKR